jgi:DNA-binding transcriptional LysR family regulator
VASSWIPPSTWFSEPSPQNRLARGTLPPPSAAFVVISLEQLAALDLSLWLGTSEAAARLLHLNQSSVSRQRRSAMQAMDLQLLRQGTEQLLLGDRELLAAERRVHQLARLKGKAPLRVDGTYASGPWLLAQPVPGWIRGNFDLPGRDLPLRLLRERVIDAWVASYQPDLPDSDDPDWWVLDLTREPVRLLAAPDHPLAGECRLNHADLVRFPSLALPSGWFPRTEAVLQRQGLWQDEVAMGRYDPTDWEGRCADGVTLTYGTSLSEPLQPVTVRLEWDLGLITGEALVVRRDLSERPAIQHLAEALQQRARSLAQRFVDVELVA